MTSTATNIEMLTNCAENARERADKERSDPDMYEMWVELSSAFIKEAIELETETA